MSSITVKGEEALLSKCTELHQRSQLQIIQHGRRSLLNPKNSGQYLTTLFCLFTLLRDEWGAEFERISARTRRSFMYCLM